MSAGYLPEYVDTSDVTDSSSPSPDDFSYLMETVLEIGLNKSGNSNWDNGMGFTTVPPLPPDPDFDPCSGIPSEDYASTWAQFLYWCEGVLTLGVGGVGFFGNLFSIAVMSTK